MSKHSFLLPRMSSASSHSRTAYNRHPYDPQITSLTIFVVAIITTHAKPPPSRQYQPSLRFKAPSSPPTDDVCHPKLLHYVDLPTNQHLHHVRKHLQSSVTKPAPDYSHCHSIHHPNIYSSQLLIHNLCPRKRAGP
ncbi:hypothetical protein JAAARDRAFT_40944 [Jaapia argillacea MUCL 33604]|uniref:Uncharacterized protein n=1 Tax=Jaapia argillacea MUCL 33604 TaxID=933084 RepID=A0A067PN02_9AGAM|nr:hypothetical protein JAAARDRAFT_40944 [Jaapia argillacea MUCL 33604]